jgi:hypothetical protein
MTSIEWLTDQMFRQGYFDGNKPLSFTNLDHLQQQAVEMHKQEIIDAYEEGQKDTAMGFYVKSGETYYNNLKK